MYVVLKDELVYKERFTIKIAEFKLCCVSDDQCEQFLESWMNITKIQVIWIWVFASCFHINNLHCLTEMSYISSILKIIINKKNQNRHLYRV